jgi:hypothetical protein
VTAAPYRRRARHNDTPSPSPSPFLTVGPNLVRPRRNSTRAVYTFFRSLAYRVAHFHFNHNLPRSSFLALKVASAPSHLPSRGARRTAALATWRSHQLEYAGLSSSGGKHLVGSITGEVWEAPRSATLAVHATRQLGPLVALLVRAVRYRPTN